MNQFRNLIIALSFILSSIPITAQTIEYGNLFSSQVENESGEKLGKGNIKYISGSYTLPISTKIDSLHRIRSWSATFTGKYSFFDDGRRVKQINPDDIVNAGIMLTHVRTIASRWNMIATTGVSLSAISDYIRMNSVALSAGVIFLYKVNNALNVGAGIVVTTAYGEPICIPMPFITWKREGKFLYELNMQGRPELKISTQLNPKVRLALSPFDAETFSAVIKTNGDNAVYMNNLFKAIFRGSYQLAKKLSINADVGYIYYHKVKFVDRSFKSFWRNLFNNDGAYKYKPSFALTVGINYSL